MVNISKALKRGGRGQDQSLKIPDTTCMDQFVTGDIGVDISNQPGTRNESTMVIVPPQGETNALLRKWWSIRVDQRHGFW